ncbi:unnamed protein product [Cylicostephanus goldi]|uniref:Uncharacterized protein n=1 Tax=Cylicostephanus goldi TaxID=71465 RepID=A0A3P6SII9_CYLGO|nr:unnamed protein product [Cylicostephanus goldi]
MSYSDPEEFSILSQKGRSPNYAKQMRPIKKHMRKSSYVTKTLFDPMDTLSKRVRRTVVADKTDGFCLDVPYSMNKKKRWEKIDATTLLKIRQNHPAETLETLVVNREDVPLPGILSNLRHGLLTPLFQQIVYTVLQ